MKKITALIATTICAMSFPFVAAHAGDKMVFLKDGTVMTTETPCHEQNNGTATNCVNFDVSGSSRDITLSASILRDFNKSYGNDYALYLSFMADRDTPLQVDFQHFKTLKLKWTNAPNTYFDHVIVPRDGTYQLGFTTHDNGAHWTGTINITKEGYKE